MRPILNRENLCQFVLCVLAAALSWRTWHLFTFDSLDEGLIASAAMKMAAGEVLYRDLFEFWAPGLLSIVALMFSWFGAELWVLRALLAVCILGIALGLFRMQRKAEIPLVVAFSAAALFLLINGVFVGLNNHWPAALFLVLTAGALIDARRRATGAAFAVAGVLAGVTALFLQYEGAVAILGGVLVAALDATGRERWRRLGAFCGGAIVLPLPVFLYFVAQGAGADLLYSTVVFPLFQYRGSNGAMPSAIGLGQAALLVGVVVGLGRSAWNGPARVLVIFAVLKQAVNLSSGNAANVLFSSYLIHLLMLWWLSQQFQNRGRGWGARFVSVGILTVFVVYASSALRSWRQYSGWIASATASVETQAGRLQVAPQMKEKIEQVLGWLAANPDSTVYFGPYAAYYYLLSGRLNPTGYSQLTENYNTPTQFSQGVTDLAENRVDTVVFLPYESAFPVSEAHPLVQFLDTRCQFIEPIALENWANYRGFLPDLEGIWKCHTPRK